MIAARSFSISSNPGRQFVPLCLHDVQIVILWCVFISPSANVRGMGQICLEARWFPCRHHNLLTRPPVWVELHLRHRSAVDGRSPDLRISVTPNLPKPDRPSGIHRGHSPLTVAGAVTDSALYAPPHRIPFSSQTHVQRLETIGRITGRIVQARQGEWFAQPKACIVNWMCCEISL